MLKVNQLIGFGVGNAAPAVSLINRGVFATSASALTTYTFSSYGIGTASSTRRIIAILFGDNGTNTGRTFSSATIGGISADVDATVSFDSGGSVAIGIVSATVPTGTTTTITATFSGSMGRAACWAVAVDNLLNTAAYDTATATSTDPLSTTINCLNEGYVLAGASTGSSGSWVWTGLTEQIDAAYGSSRGTTADLFPTANETGRSISADLTSGNTRRALVAASYR